MDTRPNVLEVHSRRGVDPAGAFVTAHAWHLDIRNCRTPRGRGAFDTGRSDRRPKVWLWGPTNAAGSRVGDQSVVLAPCGAP